MRLDRSRSLLVSTGAAVATMIALIGYNHFSGGPSQEGAPPEIIAIQQIGHSVNLVVAEEVGTDSVAGLAPLRANVTGRIVPLAGGVGDPSEGGPQVAGFQHQWPGIHATARFFGDAVVVAFDDPFNRFRISFDDGAGPVVMVSRPEQRRFRLSGLGLGPHTVRIEKVSESSGVGILAGLYVPEGGQALAPPPLPARQIEIIGDSDSVGYGNASQTRDCLGEEVFWLTDTSESYGPRVARHFRADYHLIASSGVGLVRNYGGAEPDRTMSLMYPRSLADDPAPQAARGWNPQIVVLALGSNDFDSPLGSEEEAIDPLALREEFEATYVRFVQDLRRRSPAAFFLLVMWEEYGSEYVAAHEAVVSALRADGETQIDLLPLPEMDKTGCHWHPSLDDHEKAAHSIIQYIESRLGLWHD